MGPSSDCQAEATRLRTGLSIVQRSFHQSKQEVIERRGVLHQIHHAGIHLRLTGDDALHKKFIVHRNIIVDRKPR
jgi:hypothetical protein